MKARLIAACIILVIVAMGVTANHYLYPTMKSALAQIAAESEDYIDNSSTSASATVELKLTIASLPMNAVAGSSVELYLEDDFQVPDSIARATVYFTVNSSRAGVNGGGRVYTADPIEIDDADHYGGGDDWSIRVFFPDFDTGDTAAGAGYDGPLRGETVNLVFTKSGGIKNPSEEGTHSVGYSVLGPNDMPNRGPQVQLGTVATHAKISLSDEDNKRGYELTVTGSGFNNGTTGGVYVLHNADYAEAEWWETLNCAEMKAVMASDSNRFCFHYDLDRSYSTYSISTRRGHSEFLRLSAAGQRGYSDMVLDRHLCRIITAEGTLGGSSIVGSDDKVAVTFEVTVPPFKAGYQNYICVVDGEGRMPYRDVEQFHLKPSIRVVPYSAGPGETITVFAQDFPDNGSNLVSIKVAGEEMTEVTGGAIGADGSAVATFDLPNQLSGSKLGCTVPLEATWGNETTGAPITVTDPSDAASTSDGLGVPCSLTATPSDQAGSVDLRWTPPAGAQYHFVAWIPQGITDLNQSSIMPVSAEGRATISKLNAGTTYQFIVIAGRWEWSHQPGAKWSPWSNWAEATAPP